MNPTANADPVVLTAGGVRVTVTTSNGGDGAAVVFIDTTFEPDGSDGSGGLRVLVNDHPCPGGVPYQTTTP